MLHADMIRESMVGVDGDERRCLLPSHLARGDIPRDGLDLDWIWDHLHLLPYSGDGLPKPKQWNYGNTLQHVYFYAVTFLFCFWSPINVQPNLGSFAAESCYVTK